VAIASVFAAVVATCYLFYFRLQRRLHDRPFQTLPMPDGGHPVFGHLPYLNPDFDEAQRWLAVSAADGAGRTGYWHAFTPGIVVSHWQDARQVLMAEEYREPLKILSKHIREFLGYNNLLLLTGKVWKHHRSAVSEPFRACHAFHKHVKIEAFVHEFQILYLLAYLYSLFTLSDFKGIYTSRSCIVQRINGASRRNHVRVT
jgi:hypothetical protein